MPSRRLDHPLDRYPDRPRSPRHPGAAPPARAASPPPGRPPGGCCWTRPRCSAPGPRSTPPCWSRPRRGPLDLRRLDGKGRLLPPLRLSAPTRLTVPAERDGAVLTVFLPGAATGPAPAPPPPQQLGRSLIKAMTRPDGRGTLEAVVLVEVTWVLCLVRRSRRGAGGS